MFASTLAPGVLPRCPFVFLQSSVCLPPFRAGSLRFRPGGSATVGVTSPRREPFIPQDQPSAGHTSSAFQCREAGHEPEGAVQSSGEGGIVLGNGVPSYNAAFQCREAGHEPEGAFQSSGEGGMVLGNGVPSYNAAFQCREAGHELEGAVQSSGEGGMVLGSGVPSLEFGHFSNVRSCLPSANEFVALKTLRNDANSEVAERQRDGSQGLQPLVLVRILGASRSDA